MRGDEENPARARFGPGGEFDTLRRVLGLPIPAASADSGDIGPGDDAAYLADSGIVLSTDLSVEGIHFRRDWLTTRELGRKAAVVALSDLAAMAATPLGILVSVALPPGDEELVQTLYEGIADALRETGAVLLGGDLSGSPGPLVIDVVAVGRARAPVVRSGALPGDELWVTGTLGAAAAGVAAFLAGDPPAPADRTAWAHPAARIEEARWLVEHARPHALIDLSDGLAGDAGHLAAASGVAIHIDEFAVPVAGPPGERGSRLDGALHGGEDYELLLAAAPGRVAAAVGDFEARFGCALTRIGTVRAGEGVFIRAAPGAEPTRVERGGFSHWSSGPGSPAQHRSPPPPPTGSRSGVDGP